jgi:uncharacterized protein (TIRG00374 family)
MKKWLLLIAGGFFFSIFISRIDYRGFLWLQKISIESLICIVGINAAVLFLKAWRWKYLLSHFGIHLRNGKLFYAVSAGMYLGLVSPGTSGEFGRIIKVPVRPSLGFLTIALEKAADLGVLLFISIGGMLYWIFPNRGFLWVAIPSLIFLGVMVLSFGRVKDNVFSCIEWICKRFTKREIAWEEMRAFAGRKDVLCMSIMVSLLLWIIPGVQYYLICKAIHADIGIKSIIMSLYTPYLAGVLSMIPFGLGVFEIGASHLLGRISGDHEAISASLLLFRLLTILPLVLFGLGCFVQIMLRRDGGEG